MSKSVFSRSNRAGRGFSQFKEEEKRQKVEREKRRGFLFNLFIKKGDDEERLIRFLTEEPIIFHEHSLNENGKFNDYPCLGEGCELCAQDRPSFKGAWLVADFTPWERDIYDQKTNQKTGKKETIPFRIRVLKRGTKDVGTYNLKASKFGLTNYEWDLSRVGEDSSTVYNLERGEKVDLEEDIDIFVEQFPKVYRDFLEKEGISADTLMDIVEANVMQDLSIIGVDVDGDDDEEEEAPKTKKKSGFASRVAKKRVEEEDDNDIDLSDDDLEDIEDEEEEAPRKVSRKVKPKAGAKKPVIKKRR